MTLRFFFLIFYLVCNGNFINAQNTWIRINQLGYKTKDFKVAVLLTKKMSHCEVFYVVNADDSLKVFKGTKIKKYGAYGAFSNSWRLDFSDFELNGSFYLKVDNVKSPVFTISNDVYNGTADFILRYMRQQRSKYNPFLKDSCHLNDGFIVYYPDRKKDSTTLDVSGGWHDASDYLQYLPTSANATYQMMFAYMQNPSGFKDNYDAWGNEQQNSIPDILDEAKWGLDWLLKMNPVDGEYYNQIADDRDHAGMRLPTKDSVKYSVDKGLARPVYFITGKPQGDKYKNNTQGVASSVGKFASAFALGAITMKKYYPDIVPLLVKKSKAAYAFGKMHPGNTQTISVKSPYIYAEDNYVDDMELAAVSLYILTKEKTYLNDAIEFARAEPITPWMGADSAKHYQWYPFVNLGHYLGATFDATNREEYLGFMKAGIERVIDRGKAMPFLNGVPFIWCSNNLLVGILTQIHLYKQLTNDTGFDREEAAMRDWLFGANPWGTSMICDLPEAGIAPKDPHSAFSHLYGYKISGGLVDGPVYGSIWNKLIGIKLYSPDEFALFQSDKSVYHDDFGDYSTNEPTMDGTASLSYYLSALQNEGISQKQYDSEGGIVKLNPNCKNVYLLFSAHDLGEGRDIILNTLNKYHVKGNFFFTGDFLRTPKYKRFVQVLKDSGHYIGIHSDKHLLYADWDKRDFTKVSKDSFRTDIYAAISELERYGIKKGQWFLPPYEWYNEEIVKWSKEEGINIINFTPETYTNADYTWPELKNYKTSDAIIEKLFETERHDGLNGDFILIHLGTDQRRKDKLYNKLGFIIEKLNSLGYSIKELPHSSQ